MKTIRSLTWILGALLLLTGLGCSTNDIPVFVQAVSDLSPDSMQLTDRFAGMVVAENLTEIEKDPDKPLKELSVSVGDEVAEGQPLFTYNTDELQLSLDKQRLEQNQLVATIENYREQLADLKEDREDAKESEQLSYTIEIQTIEIDLKESELKLASMESEIAAAEKLLGDAVVYAPVVGRILSISENGSDQFGNPLPYITIQQSGSFRIKGVIGELQLGSLTVGTRMRIVSRTDPSVFWYGTISLVNYDNPSQGSSNDQYFGMVPDAMTAASKYPFYVTPDSTDGLLLGQHVYIEPDRGDTPDTELLTLPASFISYDESGAPFVWAEQNGRLHKRAVVLLGYDPSADTFEISEGLSLEDHIAFPDAELCVEGAPVTRTLTAEETTENEEDLLP